MPLETLWSAPAAEAPTTRGRPMPEALRARYGGPLDVPVHPGRPTLLVNFVATVDGIVALGPGEEAGGGVISGFSEPDLTGSALLTIRGLDGDVVLSRTFPSWNGLGLVIDHDRPRARVATDPQRPGEAPQAYFVLARS